MKLLAAIALLVAAAPAGAAQRFAVIAGNDEGAQGYDAIEQAAQRIGGAVRQKRALPGVEGPQTSLLFEKTQ